MYSLELTSKLICLSGNGKEVLRGFPVRREKKILQKHVLSLSFFLSIFVPINNGALIAPYIRFHEGQKSSSLWVVMKEKQVS